MITIDSLIAQMKNLFVIEASVRFDTPEYIKFHNELLEYVHANHFEDTEAWAVISKNLAYTSSQYMVPKEANMILYQLDILKRKELARKYAVDWRLIHPEIIRVSQLLYLNGHYYESVRSAFIEINNRVKKLCPEAKDNKGNQLDGYALMQNVFSEKTPTILLGDLTTDTGRNIQRGFKDLFSGAAAALRNPKAHENDYITAEDAARQLMFASMLMYKLDEALKNENIEEGNKDA